jgi:hypothetical protein
VPYVAFATQADAALVSADYWEADKHKKVYKEGAGNNVGLRLPVRTKIQNFSFQAFLRFTDLQISPRSSSILTVCRITLSSHSNFI